MSKENFMIAEGNRGGHVGATMDEYADIGTMRDCAHEEGFDCDRLFHYCRLCSMPLDDCDCARY